MTNPRKLTDAEQTALEATLDAATDPHGSRVLQGPWQAPNNAQPPDDYIPPAEDLRDSTPVIPKGPAIPARPIPDFANSLSIGQWADKPIPKADQLLGDFVTTTSRSFLVGRTGLGKTMLGLEMAMGIASGRGFLHWRSSRKAKVLIIDGEMPCELIKSRAIDALRRAGDMPPPPGYLTIYARDNEEENAKSFPWLGTMEPLNTPAGHQFVYALIAAIGGIECVVFDNLMSLVSGDHKDETTWSGVLPLVASLTSKRIGQIWLDHTGHNSDRQYGSSTKGWRFDSIAQMTPLPDDQRQPHDMAFNLSFDAPGKARRRSPANWADFQNCIIRLSDDVWTSDLGEGGSKKGAVILSPQMRQFHEAFLGALVMSPIQGRTTRTIWLAECVRTGLIEADQKDDTGTERSRKQSPFRKAVLKLKEANLVGVDGETVHDLRKT